MSLTLLFPLILIILNLCAMTVYFSAGQVWLAGYWVAHAFVSAGVTWIGH